MCVYSHDGLTLIVADVADTEAVALQHRAGALVVSVQRYKSVPASGSSAKGTDEPRDVACAAAPNLVGNGVCDDANA